MLDMAECLVHCLSMKSTCAITLVVAGALVAASLVCFNSIRPASGRMAAERVHSVAAEKIVAAAQAYARDLAAKGVAVPSSVNLKELAAKGLLNHADVRGFDGMEVTISLTAGETHPSEVLMRARLQDASEIVLLADGSVQQLRR